METVASTYNNGKAALSTAPATDAYLAWNAPGVEELQPDEEDTAKKIGVTMNMMQQHNFGRHRHCFRATHVKTPGIVKGRLTVLSDLAPTTRPVKAPGATYNVAARYASEPVFLQADQEPGPQGLGLRILRNRRPTTPQCRPKRHDPGLFLQQCAYDRTYRPAYMSGDHAAT